MNSVDVYKKYRMLYDYHTHTTYSHGIFRIKHAKGSIMENVAYAHALGLSEIAITDHGPGHVGYGMNLKEVPKMREDIAAAMEAYPDIKVHLGVEANIIDTPNGLDLAKDDFGMFDFVLAGYHFGIPKGHLVGNKLSSMKGYPAGSTKKLMIANTDMTVRALYENDIKIITHPGDKGPFDIAEISRACQETGTLMEINTHHDHLTVDEIRIAAQYDVKFIIDSDAHKPQHVGNFQDGVVRALEAGLDISRIVNVVEK